MTATGKGKPFGFDVLTVRHGGEHRSIARFTCYRCRSVQLDLTIVAGLRMNPTMLAQTAEKRGWNADPVHKSRVVCPACRRRGGNDVDSELRKLEESMASSPTALAIGNTVAPGAVVPVREATADQRSVIRRLLEKHFDEGHGCYLDGYSDQRIAEESYVPRIVVEKLRDAAYGPIRVSPEVLAARKELEEFKAKLEVLADDATQWAQQFGEELDRVRQRVAALQKQLGLKETAAA